MLTGIWENNYLGSKFWKPSNRSLKRSCKWTFNQLILYLKILWWYQKHLVHVKTNLFLELGWKWKNQLTLLWDPVVISQKPLNYSREDYSCPWTWLCDRVLVIFDVYNWVTRRSFEELWISNYFLSVNRIINAQPYSHVLSEWYASYANGC